MRFIDTHCHLYDEAFDNDRNEALQRALDAGVDTLLLPDIDSQSTAALDKLYSEFPQHFRRMTGLHPTSVKEDYEQELALVHARLFDSGIPFIAVGEIGLDFYWDRTFEEQQLDALRRQLGIVFQDFRLLMDRNVRRNLDFVLRSTGWKNRTERAERIRQVLETVGLADKQEAMPYELSGGEQQRVCIARAILNKPILILADEATGNQDSQSGQQTARILYELAQQGTAVVFATHNNALIEQFPGRVYECKNNQFICHDSVITSATKPAETTIHEEARVEEKPDTTVKAPEPVAIEEPIKVPEEPAKAAEEIIKMVEDSVKEIDTPMVTADDDDIPVAKIDTSN